MVAEYLVSHYWKKKGKIVSDYVSKEKISCSYSFWEKTLNAEKKSNYEHTQITLGAYAGKILVTKAITIFPDGYVVERALLPFSIKKK